MKAIHGSLKRRTRTKTSFFKTLTHTNIETHAKKRAWESPALGTLVKIVNDRTGSLYVVIDVQPPRWAHCPTVQLMGPDGTLWLLVSEIRPV